MREAELESLLAYHTAQVEVIVAKEPPALDDPIWTSSLPGGWLLTSGGVVPASTTDAPGAGSRRSRRNRTTLEVTPSMTVQELKLHILQALNVHPANAQIYLNGREVLDDTCNMRQCRVFPGQTVVVVNRGLHDDNDLTGIRFPGEVRAAGAREEHGVGFGGTLLASYGAGVSVAPVQVGEDE